MDLSVEAKTRPDAGFPTDEQHTTFYADVSVHATNTKTHVCMLCDAPLHNSPLCTNKTQAPNAHGERAWPGSYWVLRGLH